jgi:putative FmdB family regulatory protein
MPIYEYACEKCGHEFEVEQRMSAEPVKSCPVCRARKVKRLISRTSFVLKGGGWYSDLYSSPTKSEAKSDSTTEKSEPSEKTEKTEKPAASASEKTGAAADPTSKSESSKSESKSTSKDKHKAGKPKAA